MLRYRSPLVQIMILGLVCFCCPGMFNALNGMGGGGTLDASAVDNANTALYAAFCVFGLLGGGITNIVGPRLSIAASGLTYALYSGSYIHYNATGQQWLLILAGALLGAGAGILWSAQGMIMLSYPREHEKGRYIAIFWIMFNLGGVIGGLVPLFRYLHTDKTEPLNNGTYIAFIAIECLGSALALTLAPPATVVRDDGSLIILRKYPNVMTEFVEVLKLFTNKSMLLLTPAFFSSNFFYSYQFGSVNGVLFNTRTRALNSSIYWLAQMVGAGLFARLLDHPRLSRRTRGIYGFIVSAVLFNAAWIGGCILQVQYDRNKPYPGAPLNFSSPKFGGLFVLYLIYGACDAIWQNFCYWVLGSLSNDGAASARYVGFYKAMQSLGSAISWQVNAHAASYMSELIGNWALIVVSLPFMFVVVKNIRESNYESDEEANQQSDQAIELVTK
ncbi:MFS general substrate transporter [Ramicandelaber brevisporus]|nr:MFS general substrate transporter [Ramicandelaber brevisporus]